METRVDCDDSLYCLNGGSCPPEESLQDSGCECLEGYSGTHCEIGGPQHDADEDDLACSLDCLHGGTCVLGDEPDTDSTGWPGPPARGMHCDCAPGYAGHFCEYRADICGNFDHICLHGAKCVKDEGSSSYSCECRDEACRERYRTQVCLPKTKTSMAGLDPPVEYYGGMAVPAFCFNGGKCVDTYVDGQWHAGCECRPLFEGPHCERIKSENDILRNGLDYDDKIRGQGAITTAIVLFCTLFFVSLLFVVRQVRRTLRRRGENNTEVNLQGFRDQIEKEQDKVTFTAFSPNGNMLFPAFDTGAPVRREDIMILSDIDLS